MEREREGEGERGRGREREREREGERGTLKSRVEGDFQPNTCLQWYRDGGGGEVKIAKRVNRCGEWH